MLSRLILIGRGLNQRKSVEEDERDCCSVLSVLCIFKKEESGGDGMIDTHVPIPNTEVKHHNGDDSAQRNNSKPPVPFDIHLDIFFYFCNFVWHFTFFRQ